MKKETIETISAIAAIIALLIALGFFIYAIKLFIK
jgi:hypothetical protein